MDVRELGIKGIWADGEEMVSFDGKYDSEGKKVTDMWQVMGKGSKRRLKVEDYLTWLILRGRW